MNHLAFLRAFLIRHVWSIINHFVFLSTYFNFIMLQNAACNSAEPSEKRSFFHYFRGYEGMTVYLSLFSSLLLWIYHDQPALSIFTWPLVSAFGLALAVSYVFFFELLATALDRIRLRIFGPCLGRCTRAHDYIRMVFVSFFFSFIYKSYTTSSFLDAYFLVWTLFAYKVVRPADRSANLRLLFFVGPYAFLNLDRIVVEGWGFQNGGRLFEEEEGAGNEHMPLLFFCGI